MWLLGRKRPLNVYGLAYTLDRIEKLMTFYEWETWPNFYPVNFHRVQNAEMAPVLNDGDFRIYASPVCHLIPTIGLRFEFPQNGKVLAYSSDTEPCPEVVKLAAGANLLIHESAGATPGHSSASQAGEIAQSAQAEAMYLIHYPTRNSDPRKLVAEAQKTFSGRVQLAEDFMEINLG
jgi:ribonuclease Z